MIRPAPILAPARAAARGLQRSVLCITPLGLRAHPLQPTNRGYAVRRLSRFEEKTGLPQ